MTGFEIVTTFAPTWGLALMSLVALALPAGGLMLVRPNGALTIPMVAGFLLALLATTGSVLFAWSGITERDKAALLTEVNEHYNVTIDHAENASDTTQIVNLTDSDGTEHLATLQIKDGRATLFTSQSEEWPT